MINLNLNAKFWKFPAGEAGFRLVDNGNIPFTEGVMIEWLYQGDHEFMRLAMVVDAVRREYRNVPIQLFMPYVPYSRQDRVMSRGESLSIKVVADLINSLKFDAVIISDPHSDVTSALINNVHVRTQDLYVSEFKTAIESSLGSDYLILAPDAGAVKKVYAAAKALDNDRIIFGSKIRNVETGEIKETRVDFSTVNFKGTEDVLIIDDIADGMGTFLTLAEILKLNTSGKIALYVTHGFFTKGVDFAHGLLDNIFVAYDYRKEQTDTYNLITTGVIQ